MKLKRNLLQFAVVREDPEVELALFRKFEIKNPILVGSGGCTAMTLASAFPQLPITLIEPNPAQIDFIDKKIAAVKSSTAAQRAEGFGIGKAGSKGLSLIEQGNFESLFRNLRGFLHEFIVDSVQIEKLLLNGTDRAWKGVFAHPYWSVAFDLFFSDAILLAMFGPAAIQHAPSESYGRYFQTVFEKGILRRDRRSNYFLHHLLLGRYPKSKAHGPLFLQKPPKKMNVRTMQCLAHEVSDYSSYDFVGLSNIFDWSSRGEVKQLASKLNRELRKGAVVLYRQLNNQNDFESLFGAKFQWLTKEAKELHAKDRSLFYSSIHIARKTA